MSSTLNMSVGKVGFLLDRVSHDCAPLQYVRELTQNSIEAIRKAGREHGVISWGYDRATFARSGIKKLSITDNGCGMNSDEMLGYLNNLSASGSEQSLHGNYGVGAKISSYARNQAGVIYLSFQNGEGSLVQIWKDPGTGEYGLRDQGGDHVASLPRKVISELGIIEQFGSGTHVVLQGMLPNEDTFSSSKDIAVRGPGQWVRRYLNTRYFRLPNNIEIRCQTAGGGDEGERYVTGQGPVLDGIALEKGTVQLSDARAHWWLIQKEKTRADLPRPLRLGAAKPITRIDTLGPGYNISCHIAAIYQNELHDTIGGTSAKFLVQQFGVTVGSDQVIIYIEPTSAGVVPNMARTQLLLDGESLPWSDWADEFRGKLPKEIREFMDQVQPAKHDSKSGDERIRSVMDLFKVPKFKVDLAGDRWISPPDSDGGATGNDEERARPSEPPAPKPVRPARPAAPVSVYTEMVNQNGTRGSEVVVPQELPEVKFVSADPKESVVKVFGESIAQSTGDRNADVAKNKAGWFTKPNILYINLDFGGVRLLIEQFVSEYSESNAARAVIAKVVVNWWEQTLKETVHGIRTLGHIGTWSKQEADMVLQGDTGSNLLTAAVMPRWMIFQNIKRDVRSQLGKPTHAKDDD
jgi:hypothetical protein